MKSRLILLLVFLTPLALAGDYTKSLPSAKKFFQLAALDRYCNPRSETASSTLEAYRAHTIEYFKGGALTSPKSVQEGAPAEVQSLMGDVPSSYIQELNKVMTGAPPATRKLACANLEQLIKNQIAIESLSIKLVEAGQKSE